MKPKILAVAALAALALAGCSTPAAEPEASDDSKPFNFLFLGGITGPLASLVESELVGVNLAIEEINADGGINGRKVVLETADTKGDPTEAVSVLQSRLAQGKKPDLVRAGLSSTEALAMVPVVSRAGIASFTSSNTPLLDDVKEYPLNRQVGAENTRQLEAIAAYVKNKGYKDLAILAAEDASGDGAVAANTAAYKGSGVNLHVHRYSTSELDLSLAYQRAIADAPDAVFSDCLGAPCARLIKARESVANGTEIPMIGGSSMSGSGGGPAELATPTAIENLQILLLDVQLKHEVKDQTPLFKTFYKGVTESGVAGMTTASHSYDGLRMYAAAAKHAKSTDGKKMVEAIDSIEWKSGDFVTFGKAVLKWDGKSAYPSVSANGFAMVQAGPLQDGLYEPLNLFQPKK